MLSKNQSRFYFNLNILLVMFLLLASKNTFAVVYCSAKGNVFSFEWINSIKVNNLTSTSSASGYTQFTTPIFQLNVGSNSINVTPGYSSGAYTENWSVFIDLNQDGIFSTNERLLNFATNTTTSSSITIPTTAIAGYTRMRVIMSYGSASPACGNFSYGEVEDYTVNIVNSTPPPTSTITTITNVGFTKVATDDLVVVARFKKNGVIYNSSIFFGPSFLATRQINLYVDAGTQIEWYAKLVSDSTSVGGTLTPSICSSIKINSCFTNAGSSNENVVFNIPNATPPPQPPVGDITLNFENLFGGVTYKAGPSITFNNIIATTTGSYFYNQTGVPFNSGYFSFINLGLQFPSPVLSLSFKASGKCTNCIQTVTVTTDGQVYGTFNLTYNTISDIVLTFPVPVTKVHFNQNFSIDDLVIDYQ